MDARKPRWLHRICCLAVAAAAAAVTGPAVSQPAGAATATFALPKLQPGTLTISVPAGPIPLGSGTPGSTITSALGTVTVTDERLGDGPFPWTATVSATAFTATGAPDIPSTAITYTPGTATTTGDGTFTTGTAGPIPTTPTTTTAYTHSGGTEANTAAWNPTLQLTIPPTATATTYQGTVQHLVF